MNFYIKVIQTFINFFSKYANLKLTLIDVYVNEKNILNIRFEFAFLDLFNWEKIEFNNTFIFQPNDWLKCFDNKIAGNRYLNHINIRLEELVLENEVVYNQRMVKKYTITNTHNWFNNDNSDTNNTTILVNHKPFKLPKKPKEVTLDSVNLPLSNIIFEGSKVKFNKKFKDEALKWASKCDLVNNDLLMEMRKIINDDKVLTVKNIYLKNTLEFENYTCEFPMEWFYVVE